MSRLLRRGTSQAKIVLITGAASGIGKSSAISMARQGAHVVVTDIPQKEAVGRMVVQEIEQMGHKAMWIPLDVTDEKQWVQAISTTEHCYGPLDVLVNNAGIAELEGKIEETSLESWHRVLSVDLDGVFLGTKYAIQSMKRNSAIQGNTQQGGSIINVSSIMGKVACARLHAYCSAKGGATMLTKSTALYCCEEKLNIRANSIHPGYIVTPMTNPFPREIQEKFLSLHPIGRLGQPLEIAEGIVFLASDESSFMTGQELIIDGGYMAQ